MFVQYQLDTTLQKAYQPDTTLQKALWNPVFAFPACLLIVSFCSAKTDQLTPNSWLPYQTLVWPKSNNFILPPHLFFKLLNYLGTPLLEEVCTALGRSLIPWWHCQRCTLDESQPGAHPGKLHCRRSWQKKK